MFLNLDVTSSDPIVDNIWSVLTINCAHMHDQYLPLSRPCYPETADAVQTFGTSPFVTTGDAYPVPNHEEVPVYGEVRMSLHDTANKFRADLVSVLSSDFTLLRKSAPMRNVAVLARAFVTSLDDCTFECAVAKQVPPEHEFLKKVFS